MILHLMASQATNRCQRSTKRQVRGPIGPNWPDILHFGIDSDTRISHFLDLGLALSFSKLSGPRFPGPTVNFDPCIQV